MRANARGLCRCPGACLRLLPVLLATLALPAAAQTEPPADPNPITLPTVSVTANRVPTPLDQTGSSVQVITADEIAQKQRRTLPDILKDSPGLNVVQTGGPGGQTSVFLRGTNSNQVKVRIDGIEVGDPSTPNGAFDFGQVLASGIERIEILRGPQSGLYGADAIGGVIDITTKRGEGPPTASATLEGGSHGTFNQYGSFSGKTGGTDYAVSAGHFRSSSTQATPEGLVPPGLPRHANAYDNDTVSVRLGQQVTEAFDLGLAVRAVESEYRFVNNPGEELSDSQQRQLFTRATAHLVSFGGVLEQTVGVGYTDYRRRDAGPNGLVPATPSFNRGDRFKADWRGDVRLGEFGRLVLGAEHQLEEIRDSPISAQTRTDAGFAEVVAKYGRLSGSATVRYDANSRFGDYATWRLAPALAIPETGTILRASGGTGFKAPSLNQLFVSYPAFGFFANPNLKAERSIGWDAGAEQALFGGRVRVGATYFHNSIDNLIDTNATFTSYANVARATTQGVEAFASWQARDNLLLRVDWTNTVTKDDILNQELLRRPRTKVSGNAQWQVTDRFFFSSTLLYLSSRIDGNRDFSVPRLRANGFVTADIAANYKVTQNVSLFGRIDNLLDRRYENPTGFLQPGIGAFAGVRAGL